MTRREALKVLDTIPTIGEQVDALEMAIEALEREPCEDCVSREAVENAIKHAEVNFTVNSAIDFTKHKREVHEIVDGIVDAQIKALRVLPSVTPQPITLEKAIDYLHEIGWMQEHDKEMAQPRWISVSERLPEDEQEILFSTKTGRVHSGKYHDDNSANPWYSYRDKCNAWSNVVTAWMPLPEPYQAEGSEE